ncbi:MAG TPA: endonuclease/exonuclease/phosphatase family protein [Spongiibacteraceae bacterium]|nr:endonuclease/exonuclease/phosphatase family protein [Spongiibacteraceae bacterium]
MKILSCNIRDARAPDGANAWAYRRSICVEVIRRQAADIICFQELRPEQFDDIGQAFPDYDSYGLSEDAQSLARPNAIFFRRDRFTVVAKGGYWLSETPTLAGSKSWQSAYIRLANWLELQECTSKNIFRVINAHLDDSSQLAREHQAQMIIADAAAQRAELMQILTADMNCDADNAVLTYFTQAGWRDSFSLVGQMESGGTGYAFAGTYHAFDGENYCTATGAEKMPMLDWIMVRGAVEVSAAEIVRDNVNGRYPSDHYFLSVTLDL